MHLRRSLGAALALGISALIAAGCGSGGVPSDAVCTVYGQSVPHSEWASIVKQAEGNLTQSNQKAPKPGSTQEKQLQNQATDYLIQQTLFEQQASKKGVHVKDSDVDSRLKQLIQSYFKGSQTAYKAELKKEGIDEATVKQRIKEQLISEDLFNKVTAGVKISDAQAQQNYNENPSQYKQKESRTVAHILVSSKSLAQTIYNQVKGGDQKVFAADAKKYSKDPSSAKNGGVLTVTQGETVPQFDKVAFSLKTGQVSPPVHSQFGWHVITARTAVIPAKQQPFSAVKSQIVSTLQQEQRSRVMQDFQTSLEKQAASHVTCKKGYTWTYTQTGTTASSTAPPATSTTKSSASGKSSSTATSTSSKSTTPTATTSASVPAATKPKTTKSTSSKK